jgi:phytoene desaturase
MKRHSVIVVGGGLGGLSAACHLAGEGHEVTVLEQADHPGGSAGRLQMEGYAFDTGPTVLTMAGILADTFAAAGTTMDDHLRLHRLDPAYRAVYADGSMLRVRAGREAMTDEIRETCGAGEAAGFQRFCGWLTELHDAELAPFINRNYDSPADLARPLAPAVRLARLGGFGNLTKRVNRYFADDRLRRLFSFQSLYAGLAPHRALALYAVITYMDTVEGVFHAEGGMAAVPRALAEAAEKAGATLRFGNVVERIVVANGTRGRVRGVRLASGEFVRADVVVCNAEPAVAYRRFLPSLPAPRVARRGTYSPSAVVWHAGVTGPVPDGVAHHNIHFGSSWQGAFDALLDNRLMPDPSTLVSVPTVSEPTLAPSGGNVLYALEPVPNLDGDLDWTVERQRVRDQLVGRVASLGYPTQTAVESFVDPLDWERRGLERGTPFSLAHRFFQTGPFRPGNVDRRVPGLVFVGAGTVPGVGIPMVLLSGRLAAARVEEAAP